MRKYTLFGALLLLILGLALGVWLALRPADRVAPVSEIVHENTASPSADAPALETPAEQPKQEQPKPAPDPVAKPTPQPEVAPAPESAAKGIVISGKVVDEVSGTALRADVSLVLGSDAEGGQLIVCEDDGTFRFEYPDWTEIPADALLVADMDRYDVARVPAADGVTIKLKRELMTRVNVHAGSASCRPESAWLIWEGDATGRQEGGKFDDSGVARIELRRRQKAGECRVFCQWFGRLVQSDVLTLETGKTYDVTLQAPAGAELVVTVIGPGGRPAAGAQLELSLEGESKMLARTAETGEVLLTGFAAPSAWGVELTHFNGCICAGQEQTVEFTTASDRKDIRFDLTTTGTVECRITANGKGMTYLYISPAEPGGLYSVGYIWFEGDTSNQVLIYGLKPGKYDVEGCSWESDTTYEAEFEVLPPPAISTWQKDFQSATLTVRVNGAAGDGLVLSHTAGGFDEINEARPQPTGEFVLAGLGTGTVELWVHGGGWCSEVVVVDPSTQPEVTVDVVASGTLKLTPRGEGEYRLSITGTDPVRRAYLVGKDTGAIDLPPGKYSVSTGWGAALWDPFEVTITAGQTTEADYGPEFTATLQMRSRDRKSLWDYKATIEKDGQPVRCRKVQTWSSGDEYFSLTFVAEGKLTLRITGKGIEDYVREFEIKRDETLPIEIELKARE